MSTQPRPRRFDVVRRCVAHAREERVGENAETVGKRLAETVFNMAALCDFHKADVPRANNEYANVDIDEEVRSMHATLERPFHEAFRNV